MCEVASISLDAWREFECVDALVNSDLDCWDYDDFDNNDDIGSTLLTPPRSPCESAANDLSEHISLADCLSSASTSRCCSPECNSGPLLKDCMWSAALTIPPEFKYRKNEARSTAGVGVIKDAAQSVSGTAATQTAASSSNNLNNSFLTTELIDQSSTDSCLRSRNTEMTSSLPHEDSCHDDDDDDSSDDVDVVSVGPAPLTAYQRLGQQSMTSSSLVRDLIVMPRSASMLAHVAEMHNYSAMVAGADCSTAKSTENSRWPVGRSLSDNTYQRLIQSAPQSPASHRGGHGRRKTVDDPLRSMSMPSSPAAVLRGPQRRCSAGVSRGRSSDSEEAAPGYRRPGTGGKRALHNVLERRRRDHLKWNFEALRCVVPTAAGNTRMPKVTILRRARDYVRQIRATAERLEAERNRLRSLHQRWQLKMATLMNSE